MAKIKSDEDYINRSVTKHSIHSCKERHKIVTYICVRKTSVQNMHIDI